MEFYRPPTVNEEELKTLRLMPWEVDVLIEHWRQFRDYNHDCFSVGDILKTELAHERLSYIASIVGKDTVQDVLACIDAHQEAAAKANRAAEEEALKKQEPWVRSLLSPTATEMCAHDEETETEFPQKEWEE